MVIDRIFDDPEKETFLVVLKCLLQTDIEENTKREFLKFTLFCFIEKILMMENIKWSILNYIICKDMVVRP